VLVYDHDTRLLSDKLTDIQHHSFRDIAAALHIHLDEHTCWRSSPLRARPSASARCRQL